jgi:hypothetical protein
VAAYEYGDRSRSCVGPLTVVPLVILLPVPCALVRSQVVSSLKHVLLARGFVEFIDHHHVTNSWNFQWKTTRYSDLDSIGPESSSSAPDGDIAHKQKINHFQKTSQ